MNTPPSSIKIVRTDLWREGKWLDLWSVVHVLSGLLLGFFLYLFRVDAMYGLVFVVVLLSVYELFELLVDIYEAPTNRIMDIAVGMLGYILAFFLFSPHLTGKYIVLTFVALLIVTSVMSIIGWHASHKASVLQERVRTKIAQNRKKLQLRTIVFRSKTNLLKQKKSEKSSSS